MMRGEYYKYHGVLLANLQKTELVRPAKESLEWHNTQNYSGLLGAASRI